MALTISRIDRVYRDYDVTATVAGGDPASLTGVDVALLPPRSAPTAGTVWTPATYASGTATVLLAGPDADATGAVVVPASADLWMRAADNPEVDAEKVERISVMGGGANLTSTATPVVSSVNGHTGSVVLGATDVGADAAGAATAAQAAAVLYAANGLAGKLDATSATVINVLDHGAVGNGTTNDTAAIQAAIDALPADGGAVFLPAGHYKTTATLTIDSNTTLIGAGEQSTFIELATAGVHGIAGTDLSHVSIRDLHVTGPGQSTAAFDGIHFALSGSAGNATFYVRLENVYVEGFGRDGVSVQTPIVSSFDRVIAFHVGRHGIHLYSSGEADGTSCVLSACYVAGAWGAGYRLKQMAYTSLNGCAADAAGISYDYDTCVGISENGCGSEEPYNFSAHNTGYTGLSRRVFNSKVTFASPYMIGNISTAFWVTNSSVVTIDGLFEGSPGNPDEPTNNPTTSLLVDTGCKATLINPSVVKPMSLATGTTTNLPTDIGSGGSGGAASDGNTLAAQATMRRIDIGSSTLALGASGSLRLTYFTATSTGTFTSLRMITGGTAAAATPTLCKMAIYSVASNGNLTLIGATANDTTLFAAANTSYSRSTASSFTLTAGQRYAIGVLVVTAAALPTFVGASLPGAYAANLLAADPRMTGAYSGQTDAPASITFDVLATMATAFYAEAA